MTGSNGHRRSIVVMGGSAGAFKHVMDITSCLPANFPAAVFIVLHTTPRERNYLAEVLDRRGPMPASQATEGQRIHPGRIYLPPPDRHLVIAENHLHIPRGPKEGLHRPSINVTFRSAAAAYASQVVGVLLSGMLDDGAAGLWEISREGGITIVQDPDEAAFPSMPVSALRDVAVDYTVPANEIAALLLKLVAGGEVVSKHVNLREHEHPERFSGFTCPECRGPLWESLREGPPEFRCRVGHIFSLKTLLDEHSSTEERKLYEVLVALEEGVSMAEYAAGRIEGEHRDTLYKEASQLREHVAVIRKILEDRFLATMS